MVTDRMSDRLPPQDLYAEQATLGAMLMESGAVDRARAILQGPQDFYREAHRRIYAAICAVDDAGDPVDVATVGAVLRRREQLAVVGGGEYLTRLVGEVPTTAHVIRYATIVRECAHRRNLILTSGEMQALAYDGELPLEVLEVRASDMLRNWASVAAQDDRATCLIGHDGYGPELQAALAGPPAHSWARSGIGALDRAMGTFAGHSTIVLVADTKTGKSIFGQQAIGTSARLFRDNDPGTYALAYVLEAYGVWRRRMAGWLGGFDSMVFRRGGAGMDVVQKWRDAEQELDSLPLLVNHRMRNILDIIRDARRIVDDQHEFADVKRLGLILIDHAQRLDADGDMVRKYDPIGLELEALSNELKCPILLPSQGTKTQEGRLQTKWSRAIEENASIVIEMTRGLETDTEYVRQTRFFGELSCTRTRLNSFGRLPYYVDVGGPDHTGYRRDLRMYDEADWRANGWRTKEQFLEWEENQRLAEEARKGAARRGGAARS